MSIPRASVLLLVPLLTALAVADPEPSLPTRIEVITTPEAPVDIEVPGLDLPVTVYDLNAPERLEARLSAGLPADSEAAIPMAKARIAGASREELQSAYSGLVQALQCGITRYPAIVFDGKAVVYGVADLAQALAYYQAWRASETQP